MSKDTLAPPRKEKNMDYKTAIKISNTARPSKHPKDGTALIYALGIIEGYEAGIREAAEIADRYTINIGEYAQLIKEEILSLIPQKYTQGGSK